MIRQLLLRKCKKLWDKIGNCVYIFKKPQGRLHSSALFCIIAGMNVERLRQFSCVVIGVSGGPDSMALLDMCRKQQLHIVVAHMNYQKRNSADRDEKIVQDYCEKYGIQCEIVKQTKEGKGNFQAFAREERYLFYEQLLHKYEATCVLLAHHLDDHIETYLMQKQRNSLVSYYGISEDTIVYRCRIVRPLLHMTKSDLEQYCHLHHVPYGIDESNLSDDYTRNQIRHTIVEPMSREEKQLMCKTIDLENIQRQSVIMESEQFLSNWDFSVVSLLKLKADVMYQCISSWVFETCKIRLSNKELSIIHDLMKKGKHWSRDIKQTYVIYEEYGTLWIDDKQPCTYAYTLHDKKELQTPYFQVAMDGTSVEAVTLSEDDFPLMIRNVKQGDSIQMRFGTKKVHRWFIDRKIPKYYRKRWPVVENVKKEIVLIPGIGCDMKHFSNNPSIFVVK